VLLDKKVILGLGIGFIICGLLMIAMPRPQISNVEVEKRARDMGMVYPDDVKALYK
jgi:hypothetical protein